MLMKMGVQTIIDEHHTPHGNHQGLSVGWLATIFLSYILTESDHKMCPVQEWVDKHRHTLERLTGQTIRPTDFTDDRLGDVLRYLSQDELWPRIEQDLSQRTMRVYRLETIGPVRLDPTVGGVHHDEEKHTLFKTGRNKAGGFGVQFKLMLGTLDPLGMPLASDVTAGNVADDPLYVPLYRRIRETLGQAGLLYIGDCKMGALETRAVIVGGDDFHLMPLAMVGDLPALLDEQVDRMLAGEVELAWADEKRSSGQAQLIPFLFRLVVRGEGCFSLRLNRWPKRLLAPSQNLLRRNGFQSFLNDFSCRCGNHSSNTQQKDGKTTLGLILFQSFQFAQDGFDHFAAPQESFVGPGFGRFLSHKSDEFGTHPLGSGNTLVL